MMASSISFGKWNFGQQVGINYGSVTLHSSDVLDKLPIAKYAEFGSFGDQDEDECLLGTRTDLLRDIREWAVSPHAKCIFWLNGMAGTGKSTISRTAARSFKQDNLLGASFFFKRGEADRGNATKFITTLTRQLTVHVPEMTPFIENAIQSNPTITTQSLQDQFDKFLFRPLAELTHIRLQMRTMVIVIDALDECEHQRNILRLLPQITQISSVNIRVFVTSRPELPIRLGFNRISDTEYQHIVLHEIPRTIIEHDISLFIQDRLGLIREEHELADSWPGQKSIQALVEMAVPLFIFAATICRFIGDHSYVPEEQLTKVLGYQTTGLSSKLEATYRPVLDQLLTNKSEPEKQDLASEFQQIIGAIVLLFQPLPTAALVKLLDCSEAKIHVRLKSLHSVLHMPKDDDSPVRLLHLSFRDFLLDPSTGGKTLFWVDEKEMHSKLATRCLLVCQSLQKNICRIPSEGTQRADIEHQTIDQYLPPELQYSCRYWAQHLVRSKDPNSMIHDAFLFLQIHFLHWLEAMSILRLTSEVVGIIDRLQSAILGDANFGISEFLHDAKRFVLKNRQIVDDAPLQLYSSVLLFTPKMAIPRSVFEADLPNWIGVMPSVEENWSAELQTLEEHSAEVFSVAFSPDGRLLASGSADKTVKLWDSATGALQWTRSHLDRVRSIAFSPNSRLLASGSVDMTIKLWDTDTGTLQRTLEGHTDRVWSVVFSPNGRLLASSSVDMTIKLWDSTTGALQRTLVGHLRPIWSVTFSNNGQLLASGSIDKTVRLWDNSGALQRTLEAHSHPVRSVAFSPNDQLLATSSVDMTVKIWDSATGALQQTLIGHSGPVLSISFSNDGRFLASGSSDMRIKLWDIATGDLMQTLKGHSDWVMSVAFSPSGQSLASGSKDVTVRLWNITTVAVEQTLDHHSGWVLSMAFSPDRRVLASSSEDKTVKLWDSATGALEKTLHGHSDWVWSVVFSSDGRLLASSSKDKTVGLWDRVTGLCRFLDSHLKEVRAVVFSPDSRLLASGSKDKTVKLWNSATGTLEQTLKGHSDTVRSVAFSLNGQLASGSDDKTVKLWDSATGDLQYTLDGHSGEVVSVAFSPDGRLLASVSEDKTLRLWDSTTGAQQKTLRLGVVVAHMKFSEDGAYLTTDLGSFHIQSTRDNNVSHSMQPNVGLSILERQWITLHGEKMLWLPTEYRPSCSAIEDNTLALGCPSGRVSIIRFCT